MPKTPKKEPCEKVFRSRTGVEAYLFPNASLHSFCLSLYARAGSMFEGEEENGITHLFEHLVFRSVNRAMNGTLYRELDRMGLCLEGCTYKEFVRFTVSGAKEHFDDVLHDITEYENYCEAHPEFENDRMQLTSQKIKETYKKCWEEHSFL